MSTERDETAEALACDHSTHVRGCQSCDEDAERFIAYRLGSDWLARDRAAMRAEGAAAALRDAADEVEALRSFAHGKNPTSDAHLIGYGTARRIVVRLLRDRAAQIGVDQ